MINKLDLSAKASVIRKKLGEDESSPIHIFTLVQSIASLTLVFYPLGKNISGACFRCPSSAVIAVNSGMSIGRQRYTLAHELYHLYFDKELSSTVCSSKFDTKSETEQCANQFASYFLIPPAALFERIQRCSQKAGGGLSMSDIIRMEQYFGVSHQAMLIRLQDEGYLTSAQAESMQAGVIACASRLGYDVSLYKPSPEDKNIRVLGHYICQADRLLQARIISAGKYEEFLLDAFRDDIVFGEDSEAGCMID